MNDLVSVSSPVGEDTPATNTVFPGANIVDQSASPVKSPSVSVVPHAGGSGQFADDSWFPRTSVSPRKGLSNDMLAVLVAVLVAVGVLVVSYPSAASWVSQLNQSAVVSRGVPAAGSVDVAEERRVLAAADAYNRLLSSGGAYDAGSNVPTSGSGAALHNTYESELQAGGGLMARLQIPSIAVDLPIYHGTSDATLLRGIGHLEGTSLPVGGLGTHAVLTGHRGLAQAEMLTNLNQVNIGDEFSISTFGRALTYRVIRTQVVNPDQTRSLLPVSGEDLVTLVTCTPLGINTQRIFVTGQRIASTSTSNEQASSGVSDIPGVPWWAVIMISAIIMDMMWLHHSLRQAIHGHHIRRDVPRRKRR